MGPGKVKPLHRERARGGSTPMRGDTGDSAFFRAQVSALIDGLYGSALRLTQDRHDAEDLVAETLTRGWARLDTLEDRQRFPRWIHRILVNLFISNFRRHRVERGRRAELPDDGEFSLFEQLHQPFLLWWGNPEREFLGRLLRTDIARAVQALPERYRTVVVLAEIEGYSYAEIAHALRIPTGTVRSRLNRGRTLLQRALWRHAADAGLVPAGDPPPRPDGT